MGNNQSSINEEANKWFLVLSNLSYLLPTGVTAYKMFKPTGKQMNKIDGSELIILFLFVTFFSSWSYHTCRGDIAIETGIDPEELKSNIPPEDLCKECPNPTSMSWTSSLPGSKQDPSLHITKFIDHFLAIFTLFMVLIHVVPISEKMKKLFMVIGLVWMVLFLSCGNDLFAAIPVLLSSVIVLVFWWKIRNHQEKTKFNRNTAWSLSLLSTILAFVFFKIDTEPYWLKHSLWHILGAVAGALLLTRTASCYEGVKSDEVKIPKWMQMIFSTPNECEKYNDILNHKCG
jgi:hypothetical protein